jgi:hypothetical protein
LVQVIYFFSILMSDSIENPDSYEILYMYTTMADDEDTQRKGRVSISLYSAYDLVALSSARTVTCPKLWYMALPFDLRRRTSASQTHQQHWCSHEHMCIVLSCIKMRRKRVVLEELHRSSSGELSRSSSTVIFWPNIQSWNPATGCGA